MVTRITVVVPTYQRASDLARCLAALEQQTRAPENVVVVRRNSDAETEAYLASRASSVLPLSVLEVTVPGQVAALNAAIESIDAEIVAFLDDDAAPRRRWLELIEQHFARDPLVGGVGGRDHIVGDEDGRLEPVVGLVQWFGKPIGNHHRGVGTAREVHLLKGANMSYRSAAIAGLRFDGRLRGGGAQVANDLAFSLAVGRNGWKLIYDPEVAVDHYQAERFDEDRRGVRSLNALRDRAHNHTLVMLEYLPLWRRPFFLAWAVLIGTRDLAGPIQCLRLARERPGVWSELRPVTSGRLQGLRTLYSTRHKRG